MPFKFCWTAVACHACLSYCIMHFQNGQLDWWNWEILAPSDRKYDHSLKLMPLKSQRAEWKLRKCVLCFLWHVSWSQEIIGWGKKYPSEFCASIKGWCTMFMTLVPRKGKKRWKKSPNSWHAELLLQLKLWKQLRGSSFQKSCQKFKSGNLLKNKPQKGVWFNRS